MSLRRSWKVLVVIALGAAVWITASYPPTPLPQREGGTATARATAGDDDASGEAAFNKGFDLRRAIDPPPIVIYDQKPDPPGAYKNGPPK